MRTARGFCTARMSSSGSRSLANDILSLPRAIRLVSILLVHLRVLVLRSVLCLAQQGIAVLRRAERRLTSRVHQQIIPTRRDHLFHDTPRDYPVREDHAVARHKQRLLELQLSGVDHDGQMLNIPPVLANMDALIGGVGVWLTWNEV